jgi:tetratricopeptide (TPR) repeat protein
MKPAAYICFTAAAVIFALAAAAPSAAQTSAAADVFKQASALYVQGKYDEAIKEYYKPIQEGYESGHLYYNLGNCFLKKNNIGYAILYYEKAKRLIPTDADLRANYEFAESLIKNRQGIAERPWLNRRLDKVFNPLTTDVLTVVVSLFYVMIFAILTAGIFVEKIGRYSKPAISAAAVFLLISSYVLYERLSTEQSVVLVEKADARYEPFDKATVFFTLHEGMKAAVVDSNGQWYKIKRPDGKAGWVQKNDIGLI